MDLKSMLKAIIAVIIPFLYSALIGKVPDFPLTGDVFLQLVLWIVGLAVGGWQANKVLSGYKATAAGAALSLDWKSLFKAVLAVIIPAVYSFIISKMPDFPLTGDVFVQLILWIFGLFVGGWQAKNVAAVYKLPK